MGTESAFWRGGTYSEGDLDARDEEFWRLGVGVAIGGHGDELFGVPMDFGGGGWGVEAAFLLLSDVRGSITP